ncbi:hypothetical protein AB7M16_003148 [Bradyrhizobium sp. USDA 372]
MRRKTDLFTISSGDWYVYRLESSAVVPGGHLLNSLVGNSEIRHERLFARYRQNANKTDGWSELLLVVSMHREDFPEKSGIEPTA